MQAVVLGGGKGTRLGEHAGGMAKPLVEVGGKPFILYLIDMLRRFGFKDIIVMAGPFAHAYEASLGDGSRQGVRFTFVPEEPAADTAGALRIAAHLLAERFLMLNGDSFLDFNLLDLAARPDSGSWLMRMALRPVEDTSRYGAVTLSGDKVTGFGEKSASGPGLINAGAYWLKREIVGEIGPPPVSMERVLIPLLVSRGLVEGVVYRGRFIDIGTPGDLTRARGLMAQWQRRPAAFLDRDGVLNRDTGYVRHREDFTWIKGAERAVKRLNDTGYFVFVVTNQSAVARGLCTEAEIIALHAWLNGELRRSGAHIDAFYYCPHHPDGKGAYARQCDCRKPAPGMLLRAMAEWPVDREASFMIGDKDIDMAAAQAAGIRGHRMEADDLDGLVSRIIG